MMILRYIEIKKFNENGKGEIRLREYKKKKNIRNRTVGVKKKLARMGVIMEVRRGRGRVGKG